MKISDAYVLKKHFKARYHYIRDDEFERDAAFLIGYRAWQALLEDAEARHYFRASSDAQQTLFGSKIIFARDPDIFMMALL